MAATFDDDGGVTFWDDVLRLKKTPPVRGLAGLVVVLSCWWSVRGFQASSQHRSCLGVAMGSNCQDLWIGVSCGVSVTS